MTRIGVSLVGYGTIGTGVIEILQEEFKLIKKRKNIEINLRYVIDKDIKTPRRVPVKNAILSDDYKLAINDKETDVIIELVGGTTFAYKLIEEALKANKCVVTANKALLAEKGFDLFELAEKQGVYIGFEASVCGGIPIIRIINEALSGDSINSIYGIVNGTTNYILTKMYEEKKDFRTALQEAQKLGFAEADPTLDISGGDAAHKIAILSSLAFNTNISFDQVYYEGIDSISIEDIDMASELGYIIKLIAQAKRDDDNNVEVFVSPLLLPKNHVLSSIRNEYNAVLVNSKYLGLSMYYGKGAGSRPTATAVVADIIDIAEKKNNLKNKIIKTEKAKVKNIGETYNRYYIRLNVIDKCGVLSKISGKFAEHNISIASVLQKERSENDFVPLILTTHLALESNVRNSLKELQSFDFCKNEAVVLRIIE